MNIPYVFKKCTKCGEWLVVSSVNFNKHKGCKYGLESRCKKCKLEYQKQRYEENKDKKTKYYEENKDKILEYQKQYYEDNKDKIAEQHKQYRDNNKDKIEQYRNSPQGQVVEFNKHNRRRIKAQNQGNGINKEQWLECMKFFGFRCAYSGQVLSSDTRSLDHIKSLNNGGENEIWNLVPMYKPYNSSKNDKNLLEWYKKQDFFSEERLQKIYEWQEYAFNKYANLIENITKESKI